MEMRPLFKVVLVPSAPMKDETLHGLVAQNYLGQFPLPPAMATNEMLSGAWEIP
jgi:hypothetical protein